MRLITQSVPRKRDLCMGRVAETVLPPNSNILACHVKSCNSNNFPLQLNDIEIEIREADYNPDFLTGFWPKIEWKALVDTAKAVSLLLPLVGSRPRRCRLTCTLILLLGRRHQPAGGGAGPLPAPARGNPQGPPPRSHGGPFIWLCLHARARSRPKHSTRSCRIQIHIEEGSMVCPNCKHSYPIANGIPNMVRPAGGQARTSSYETD